MKSSMLGRQDSVLVTWHGAFSYIRKFANLQLLICEKSENP